MLAKNMKEWHKAVRKKYNNRCAECSRWFEDNMLAGHHILSKGSSPELKLEVDNGMAVCFKCHEKIHRGLI